MKDFALKDLPNGKSLWLPPAIDTHTHGRRNEYADENIGPLMTILEAAEGGVGTRCFQPNTKPGLTNMKNIEKYGNILEPASLGSNYMYVGLRDDNLDQVEEALKLPNVIGIKVYPALAGQSVTTSFGGDDKAVVIDNSVEDGSTLDKAFRLAMKYNKAISFHAESPERGHDPVAEIDYVTNVILPYARKYPGAKIIVAHVSLELTARLIEETNNKFGTNIHMELTPHHMFFAKDDNVLKDPKLKCFPPLRSFEDMLYLRGLLSQIGNKNRPGLKLMLGSDHAPHPKHIKDKPYDEALGGIPNLRDCMAIILSLGEKEGMTYEQLVQFTSGTASKLLNIPMHKETIQFKKGLYVPTDDYYDGAVYNPFKGKKLNYGKI